MSKTIVKNKKAYFNYEIEKTIEGGLVLLGSEIKLIRLRQVNITNSYAIFTKNQEMFILNMQINPSKSYQYHLDDPLRSKKVLLNKKQLQRLALLKEKEKVSFIPTKLYFKGNLVKVEIGIGRGKKKHDKRESIKKRDQERMISRFKKQ